MPPFSLYLPLDMAESMVKVAGFKHGLTTEERDLFSVAFKNSIGPKRSALKIISGIGDKTDTPEKLDIIQELKDKVKHSLIKPNIHHFYNILVGQVVMVSWVLLLFYMPGRSLFFCDCRWPRKWGISATMFRMKLTQTLFQLSNMWEKFVFFYKMYVGNF